MVLGCFGFSSPRRQSTDCKRFPRSCKEKSPLADGLNTSDAVRYALFVVAGLSSAAKSSSGDGDDEPASGPATMASLAMGMVGENLETLVSWYCEELQIPSGWNLLDLLKQGLAGGGEGLSDIVFSAGDIVIKKALPADHPQFQWLQGLFEKTFLGVYTRDRKGERVPKSLEVQGGGASLQLWELGGICSSSSDFVARHGQGWYFLGWRAEDRQKRTWRAA